MKNIFILITLFLFSCNSTTENRSIEEWKEEIREAEKQFAEMAKEEGISKAFLTFSAPDAVLMRANKLVIGAEAIKTYFGNRTSVLPDEQLAWKPDFIDVAKSGDLGYTYGHYVYSYTDSTGSTVENEGVFHTVWKRQIDGSWKFVWD